mmetsp:Transcript_44911/g.66059  ORF Transcript_44911/g.66059 Transcript_44911/m.66059 type:complete len:163 (-) Transcript_44911:71-559(-)
MTASAYISGAEIDEVFDHFDTEGNGLLETLEAIRQAVYSTGCAPTADELTAALADVAEEDGSLTKKAFKSLIVQMQRSIPREQDVLADVETLRGDVAGESFTAAAFENLMQNVGDKLTEGETKNFSSLVHAHLDASGMLDQYSLTHTMLHFQDTELQAESLQ